MTCAALLLAAGSGTRFGGDRPKVLTPLLGQPVLAWSLQALAASEAINHIVVMVSEDSMDPVIDLVESLDTSKILDIVLGGQERQETVRRGLEHLSGDEAPDHVLIHDSARPGLSAADIDRLALRLTTGRAAGLTAGMPAADTLVRAEESGLRLIDRQDVYRLQTPQAFAFVPLLKAHQAKAKAKEAFTCDATLFQAAQGEAVDIVTLPQPERLMKLTFADDLASLARILEPQAGVKDWEIRAGTGFDVHAFGDPAVDGTLWLCGIELAGERPLKGHSDADVGLHTLTDALYGALAEGDIGHHFPPSDPQWKGAASPQFLEHAVQRVKARGGEIINVDLTLICEQPKIGPHREAMRKRVATIMNLSLSRVAIKATTTEGLGFTGRGEGIAAQATVSLKLPAETTDP